MSKVVQITDQNFEKEVLESDIPTEVDFWAPWCGPCKMVIPVYEKLSEEYEGRFKFCMLNVDQNPQMAAKYQIMSIPMQKYFANGENIDEILGAVPESTIRAMVEDILKRFPSDNDGKLKVLLSSWIEHNKQDNGKIRKWAEKTSNIGGDPIYNSVLQAIGESEKMSERLARLLIELQQRK